MASSAWQFRSAVPGIDWPAIPGADAAASLALQYQLEKTQWLPAGRLLELQLRQLDVLLRHAYETVPYYRESWRGLYDPGSPITAERFGALPLLTRGDLQTGHDALRSERVPAAHGAVAESRTTGSTGSPVRVLKTALDEFWWRALTVRDHRWHGRDLGGRLAAIRQQVADGEAPGWGPATDDLFATGASATLHIRASIDDQLDWLARQQPDYLLTYPSNVAELAARSLARGVRLQRLREVRTIGEVLTAPTRKLCRRAWGVPVTDAYSSDEVGYIALQCPAHEHYHAQSESLVVEILDAKGRPCAPGAIGRVVVTSLHHFAMPLVRYDIGDYAEAGAACDCGRGLPVLTRILGRVRNMLRLASGAAYWPMLGTRDLSDIAPIRQQQVVQKSFDVLEIRLVADRRLSAAEEDRLRRIIQARFPAGFRISVVYCENIPRGAGGKFEEFLCEVAPATPAGPR